MSKPPSEPHLPPPSPALRRLAELFEVRQGLPITSHRPAPVGPGVVLAKRLFRRAFQPFINELLRKQTQFNEQVVELAGVLFSELRAQESSQWALKRSLERKIAELESRLNALSPSPTDEKPPLPLPKSNRQ